MIARGAAGLRLATRTSALARAQSDIAIAALQRHGATGIELVPLTTSGDRQAETPLQRLEGQGWFTAELERSLLDGRADIAVHSAKDLPSALAPGLVIAALLPRGDARDAAVTRDASRLGDLPAGATVGTSSARRIAFLAADHPALRPVAMRGNVDTRLRKLDAGQVDALVLACAGLERLGVRRRYEALDPGVFVPAPAQGAIALEAREASVAASLCAAVADAATAACVRAERAVLAALGGGCLLPLGAYARREADQLVLTAAFTEDGGIRRAELTGDPEQPERLGAAVAALLR
ncbi:MAG: hydroxymethylbilane synthase [Chloroflexi bacterium]|nr:MAG: hydroxymethylbilane synthase [Chloroflexota bacterium]